MKVWSVKKQSCGLFLAKERESGTVAVCNGRRAISLLTAKAVKQTASPVTRTKEKSTDFVSAFFNEIRSLRND